MFCFALNSDKNERKMFLSKIVIIIIIIEVML